MSKEKKRSYRVVGVGFTKPITEVAAELEKQLNGLEEEGYGPEILSVTPGILLVGRKREEEEQSGLGNFLDALLGRGRGIAISGPAAKLLALVQHKMGDDWLENYEAELPKVLPSVLQDAPSSVITEVAKECEEFAVSHEREHDPDHNRKCPLPGFLRAVAKEMRAFATRDAN